MQAPIVQAAPRVRSRYGSGPIAPNTRGPDAFAMSAVEDDAGLLPQPVTGSVQLHPRSRRSEVAGTAEHAVPGRRAIAGNAPQQPKGFDPLSHVGQVAATVQHDSDAAQLEQLQSRRPASVACAEPGRARLQDAIDVEREHQARVLDRFQTQAGAEPLVDPSRPLAGRFEPAHVLGLARCGREQGFRRHER